jgi:hypothetical protein
VERPQPQQILPQQLPPRPKRQQEFLECSAQPQSKRRLDESAENTVEIDVVGTRSRRTTNKSAELVLGAGQCVVCSAASVTTSDCCTNCGVGICEACLRIKRSTPKQLHVLRMPRRVTSCLNRREYVEALEEYRRLLEENEMREESNRWRCCTRCAKLLCSSCDGEGCALEGCESMVCESCAEDFSHCAACNGHFCICDCEVEHRRRKRCFAEQDSEFTSQLPSPIRPSRKQTSIRSIFQRS